MGSTRRPIVNFLSGSRDFLRRCIIISCDASLSSSASSRLFRFGFHLHRANPWRQTARKLWGQLNDRMTIMSSLFARQCHAIAAQRIRRAVQIIALYRNLGYDRKLLQNVVEKMRVAFLSKIGDRPLHLLCGMALFAWSQEQITDDEIRRFVLFGSSRKSTSGLPKATTVVMCTRAAGSDVYFRKIMFRKIFRKI